jgi:serine/threonine-protein kinase HipA
MRKAEVCRNGVLAGTLTETDKGSYIFMYDDTYFKDDTKPGISLTLPKKQMEYSSEYLFPFFYNMLSEGTNRVIQSKQLKIDEQDFFGLLLATAGYDTIGAITVKQIN